MEYKSILVVCDGEAFDKKHILQMVCKANMLAKVADMTVSVLCIGEKKDEAFCNLMKYGADKIILVEMSQYQMMDYSNACEVAMKECKPQVVMFPATPFGKAVAATLSVRFGAGLTADCIDIAYTEEGEFHFLRSAMADSVIAKIKCINCDMAMGTVKENVFVAEEVEAPKSVLVQTVAYTTTLEAQDVHREHLEVIEEKGQEVQLEKYDVIFGIGRGVGDVKTCQRIMDLAQKLNVGVACTRAVVEEGWLDKEYQVGQSGKGISPRLYFAFGISGACQHIVGIRNAKTIIAVNSNPEAPIAQYADYMLVTDLHEMLAELEKEFV